MHTSTYVQNYQLPTQLIIYNELGILIATSASFANTVKTEECNAYQKV